jgi:uncharacterized protein YecE (DUF72 family)
MQLFMGQAELKGDFSRYTRQFQALEIATSAGHLPRVARLRAWKSAAPDGFVFSVVLPDTVGSLEASERSRNELEQALAAAELVAAEWLLLRTPPDVRPGVRSRNRLTALFQELRAKNRKLAWEPAGLWETAQAQSIAGELGVTLVRDLTREDTVPTSTIYTRIRATGARSAVNAGLVQKLAERISEASTAIVIVEGDGALRVKRLLGDEVLFLADGDESEAGAE